MKQVSKGRTRRLSVNGLRGLFFSLLMLCTACEESSAPNVPLVNPQATNLIRNGNFNQGAQGWTVLADSEENLLYSDNGVDNYGRYCVWVGDGGDEPYDLYLYQDGLGLEANTTYTLAFDAVTSTGQRADFSVKVGQSVSPYTAYSTSAQTLSGGEAQAKEVSFTMSGADRDAQLEFQLGGKAEAQYFCFDDVSLAADAGAIPTDPTDPEPEPSEPADPAPPTDSGSLRELADARGVLIGAALRSEPLRSEATYKDVASREFNLLFPEGSFLISEMHTPEDPFRLSGDLGGLDAQVDFALENGAEVQAFHLVWFLEASWAPWLNDIPDNRRREFIRTRIQDVMARYSGKVNVYNVVNEAFEKDGTLRGQTSQDTENWLYEADPEEPYGYIEYAFRQAREADPDATLYYNDYGMEFDGPKWDAVLEMVRNFKARGVPIDGVGFQGHLNMKWGELPDPAELAEHMAQLNVLGVEARITEFDVGTETGGNDAYADKSEAERLAIQAQTYKDYLNVCLDAPNCDTFAMWGFTDKYSWITEERWGGSPTAKPLIFDADYEPKAAYHALQEALR